ncbi:hypothetical protein AB0M43_37495 [Longispora sp. NPDC051575]|uniref:hypothetical protein n=1 Tax=Longispora sp. NPDC051575 TaxID=3154943 RepID=UPI0034311424
MNEIDAAPTGVVMGVIDTAGVDDLCGGRRIVSVQLLDDTGAAAPAQWMTPGQSYTLRFDGTGWAVTGGRFGRSAVYRLVRGGRYVTTLPTFHGDEPLDPDHQYLLVSIVAEEPTWQLRRGPLLAEFNSNCGLIPGPGSDPVEGAGVSERP